MLITEYGIIIFLIVSWIVTSMKERNDNSSGLFVLGFDYQSAKSRHEKSSKPVGCRRKRNMIEKSLSFQENGLPAKHTK